MCTRYEAVVTQMEMTEEWTTSEQEQHTICQRKGQGYLKVVLTLTYSQNNFPMLIVRVILF